MGKATAESPHGTDLFGDAIDSQSKLKSRFVATPFSIFSSAAGEWQDRKRAWIELGIQSETGRDAVQSTMASLAKYVSADSDKYKSGKKRSTLEVKGKKIASWVVSSIFDPVLCEIAYKWWCPQGGQILDPFCGGSVRGVVAGCLGYNYWGCDLRQEQIDANNEQADKINPKNRPVWVCGDSRETLLDAPMSDFIFSCPPYGDLEVYSDDPRDISNKDFPSFVSLYREIISKACEKLKNDRFACWVVGDYRDKTTGHYRNLPGISIKAFRDCGLHLYNDIILNTVVGTGTIRAASTFGVGRKVIRQHQSVQVFVKGDWREAANRAKEGWDDRSLIRAAAASENLDAEDPEMWDEYAQLKNSQPPWKGSLDDDEWDSWEKE